MLNSSRKIVPTKETSDTKQNDGPFQQYFAALRRRAKIFKMPEMYSRRRFIQSSAIIGALAAFPLGSFAALEPDFQFDPESPLISAPKNPSDWPEFRKRLASWREQKRRELKYSDEPYRRPEFTWASRCFACCFLMLFDETFYDHDRNLFKVKSYLDHGRREFGGYDAVVLWHAYPRIGFDERNQFDFYRDQPGGLPGLHKLVDALHKRGVQVFVDYNPWDTGTRREGISDVDALVEIVRAIGADGIFLDTMDQGASALRAKLDSIRPGLVLESEGALPLKRIHDHHLSWGQWFSDSEVPGVLRNKWFEHRHMQHQIKRWDRDHSGELQMAWMNGSGMLIWENVFGAWVGWNAHDRSIIRAMLPIQRHFADAFDGENWTPLLATEHPNVYASQWAGNGLRMWTLVNRSEQAVKGNLLKVSADGEKFFDLVAGSELRLKPGGTDVVLTGNIPPRGIGCFAAVRRNSPYAKRLRGLLANQKALNGRVNWDTSFPSREPVWKKPDSTKKSRSAPEGMVEIPAARFTMAVEYHIRECGFYESTTERGIVGADLYKNKTLSRDVTLGRYAIDETPVTNAQFAEFLKVANYRPRHAENFLKHWANDTPPSGREDHPVVYIDLEDARAYARWAGKRLPTEAEWQFAAEGHEHRVYPWGDEMRPDVCNNGRAQDATAVKEFPAGRSSFGCYDMCGNVWHWTESERSDGRTRFCILKGGSWFKAKGSIWYADGGPLPCRFASKFLLMWPGLDRCSTIGFRCVVDLFYS